jgi:DNA mismatch endonuclease (patch repair protein)
MTNPADRGEPNMGESAQKTAQKPAKKTAQAVDDVRSYTMSRIKSKDTSIEVTLRKALWHTGIRYRKNYAKLPGAPDIAITKHQIAIFCDGEFWHGKNWGEETPRIGHNREYWLEKIERNVKRDIETDRLLYGMGWTVLHFWGAEIQKGLPLCIDTVKYAISQREAERAECN